MGYIDSFEDIMAMETGFLQYTMQLLEKEYAKELKILNITLPKVDKIPAVRFDKAKELVAEKYNRKIRNPFDLEPEEETLIGQYFKEESDADFVFVTHYPSKKRPFYAMDDPHGGLGIGLERLTMKLVGEDNVRETTLYPRDLSRLEP